MALSLDKLGNPRFLKMRVTPNLKQASVKKFAHVAFADGSVIHSDGYRSYIPALAGYSHKHRSYDPNSGLLHWLHIVISNAKSFILGTYHGLPKRWIVERSLAWLNNFRRLSKGYEVSVRSSQAVCLIAAFHTLLKRF